MKPPSQMSISALMSGRHLLLCLSLWAGTLGANAQGGWLVNQDSIQQGMYSGSGRSIRQTPNGFLLFSNQVNVFTPFRTGIQLKQLADNGQQSSSAIYSLDTVNRNLGYIDPVANCTDGGFAFPMLDFLGGGNMYCKGHLFRTNEWGDTLWTKVLFAHPASDSLLVLLRTVTQCSDGGFCIGGALDTPSSIADGYLIRTNDAGDTLWTRTYPVVSEILDIESNWDGGFIVSGYRFTQPDVVTMQLDSIGNVLWTKPTGANSGNCASIATADSGVVTLTSQNANNGLSGYFQLTKWWASGQQRWSRLLSTGYSPATHDLEELIDGSLIFTASYDYLAILEKLDANGDSIWQRKYDWFPSTGSNVLFDVEPTADGGFVACGRAHQVTGDPHPGLETIIVLKTDSMGCVVPGCQYTGIETQFIGLEDAIKAYPNPSTGPFTLELDLPEQAPIEGELLLQVFDMQGRQVLARKLGRDRYQRIALDLSSELTGLYSAHLSDGRRILTGVRLVVE